MPPPESEEAAKPGLAQLKRRFTLQTQLTLPLMPLIFDTVARVLFLRNKLYWYEVTDLVTLLATYSFFCLGLMFAVKQTELSRDDESYLNIELVRQKLLNIGLVAMMSAGAISFYRAFNERYPELKLSEENGIFVFSLVVVFIVVTFFTIITRYSSYVSD